MYTDSLQVKSERAFSSLNFEALTAELTLALTKSAETNKDIIYDT